MSGSLELEEHPCKTCSAGGARLARVMLDCNSPVIACFLFCHQSSSILLFATASWDMYRIQLPGSGAVLADFPEPPDRRLSHFPGISSRSQLSQRFTGVQAICAPADNILVASLFPPPSSERGGPILRDSGLPPIWIVSWDPSTGDPVDELVLSSRSIFRKFFSGLFESSSSLSTTPAKPSSSASDAARSGPNSLLVVYMYPVNESLIALLFGDGRLDFWSLINRKAVTLPLLPQPVTPPSHYESKLLPTHFINYPDS